ncbi:MAG: aminoacyl-tRNA hydrolase [Bacteroidota bacterium]|nr:aminoacyl-tRNA hydrolase [Bacteroidota bacterium]
MKCIVGLGNPGNRYRHTRHNIGFRAAEVLIEKFKAQHSYGNELYECYKANIDSTEVLIVMPQTYMNNSGFAVREFRLKHECSVDDLLIIYDDFQLPFGTLRMRTKGSDGGHNGLASIIYQLQSDMIPRMRAGVGGTTFPEHHTHELMAEYVLTNFDALEEKFLPQLLLLISDACKSWIEAGLPKTMNLYNRNFFNPEKTG